MSERIIEGTILTGPRLDPVEGRLVIEDGVVATIEEASVASEAIVFPAFINAHTHIGDSIAKDAGSAVTVEALFAPPDGLKHQILRNSDPADLIDAMARTFRYMQAMGTSACYDFREGGIEGVEQFREASEGISTDSLAFGRGEPAVLDVADGYGASGAADGNFEQARNAAREADKPFAIHAGEVDAADINPALDLDPTFIVHMVHAESIHLDRVEDMDVPVVCCPRSNLVTGVGQPPIDALAERTTVALGTDNVMINNASMFREMATAVKVLGVNAVDALRMATVNGASILDRPDGCIEPGRPARVVVLDGASDNLAGTVDPVHAVATRACGSDIDEVLLPPLET